MFAGTGGLPDYSLPDDTSYPGAQLLATPSPTRWPVQSPTSAAAQHRLPAEGQVRPLTLDFSEATPDAKKRKPDFVGVSSPGQVQPGLQELAEATPNAKRGRSGAPASGPVVPTGAELVPDLAGAAPEVKKSSSPVVHPPGAADETAGDRCCGATSNAPPPTGTQAGVQEEKTSGPVVHSPGAANKTFAGRYCPKTEAGAAAWACRRQNFETYVPAAYQSAKLQLSFWKFCADAVKDGSQTEEEAAQEFVRLGLLA